MPTTDVKLLHNVGTSRHAWWITDERVRELNLKAGLEFSIAEYERRHERLRSEMSARGLDAVTVSKHSDLRYLTGFHTYAWNAPLLVATADSYRLCLVEDDIPLALIRSCADELWHYGNEDEWFDGAAQNIRKQLWSGARVGFNGIDGFTPARLVKSLAESGLDVVDSGRVVESCRLILSEDEQVKLREAAVHTARGLQAAVAAASQESATDSTIAAAILAGIASESDSVTRGEAAVASGWHAGITHAIRGEAPVPGRTTFLEYAGSASDYCAPVIRTLCHGTPSAMTRRLDELARIALDTALRYLRAGVPASEVASRGMAALRLDDPRIFFHGNFGYPVGIGQRTSWMDGAHFHVVTSNPRQIRPGMAFHIPAAMILIAGNSVAHSHTVIVHEEGLEVVTAQCGPPEMINIER